MVIAPHAAAPPHSAPPQKLIAGTALAQPLVMRDGAIVAKRYHNGEIADALHEVRSVGKSLTALLADATADRGKLSTDGHIDYYWPAANSAISGIARPSA